MAITGFYLSLFLLSIIAEYLLLKSLDNRRAGYYVVLFTLISVVCLAYVAYSISLDAGMALVANQFTYLDGTFVMMFFLFCILDICNIKVTKKIFIPMLAIGLFFLGLAFTTGYNDLFYIDFQHNTYAGASHLQTVLGPFYQYYVIYVVLQVLVPICILIYSAFNRRKISYKYSTALGVLLVAIVSIYFAESAFGSGFDMLPLGYVIMEYVIVGIVHRIGLYDISRMAANVRASSKEYGCIIFDRRHYFVGANETARYFFPELEKLKIDCEVNERWVYREFVEWIDSFENGNTSHKRYDRNERSLDCSIKKYCSENSEKVYGYLIEIWDDTEEYNHIQTLNQLNEKLERAVESANAANIAKSRFLANMSHEIRTPINAILGMNEITLRECKEEAIVPYLQDIRSAGQNLLSIINDILDFSKIEAGKVDLVESEYELETLIKDIIVLNELRIKEAGLEFVVNVEPGLPSILYGDSQKIKQIMINLLSNAAKYTHEGSVELKVRGVKRGRDVLGLEMSVKDTGIGIKKEDADKLFERFTRVDEVKNKNIEGTGLGLAITDRFVKMMGGVVKVNSVYGKGSTFTVILPQKIIDDAPISAIETKPAKKVERNYIDAEGLNILVVDDVAMNLKVAKGLLKPTGANVVMCKSGAECLETMAKQHFDIVLMDHMMPNMDGLETLKRAKESPDIDLENVVIIALTANAIAGVREFYIEAGFDDYLSKPIIPEELEEMVNKYGLHKQ